MAKAKSTAAPKRQANPTKLGTDLELIGARLKTVECTAICVELALRHQNGELDEEIARCIQRNVVDALSRLREQIQLIARALGRTPAPAENGT